MVGRRLCEGMQRGALEAQGGNAVGKQGLGVVGQGAGLSLAEE